MKCGGKQTEFYKFASVAILRLTVMDGKKELKDMTLEELWQLFPVVLTPHRPQWKEWAAREIMSLRRILADYAPLISHIGSTAVDGIMAKPIIDILIEMPADCDWRQVRGDMEKAGYLCMACNESRMSFNKGYTPEGYAERVFHAHVHEAGDNDEICFRDYLIAHPDVAREYEALKSALLPAYRHDRDGYTAAKSAFVKRIVELAKGVRLQ